MSGDRGWPFTLQWLSESEDTGRGLVMVAQGNPGVLGPWDTLEQSQASSCSRPTPPGDPGPLPQAWLKQEVRQQLPCKRQHLRWPRLSAEGNELPGKSHPPCVLRPCRAHLGSLRGSHPREPPQPSAWSKGPWLGDLRPWEAPLTAPVGVNSYDRV